MQSYRFHRKSAAFALFLCACGPLAFAAQQPAPPLPVPAPASVQAAPQPAAAATAAANSASSSQVGAAWKILTEGLAEGDADRRAMVLSALGTIGVRSDVVRLIENSLTDKSVTVRQRAATTLGDLKSRASARKLYVALDDESPVVIYAAATALWNMNDRKGEDIFTEILAGDRTVSRGTVGEGLHFARQKLHDPGALAQIGAAQAVGAFFGPAGFAVTLVEELAKDKAAPARAASAKLLGASYDADSREALRLALEDKSWLVRATAAEALALHGSRNDVVKIAPLLADDRREVRYAAAAAIVRMSPSR